MMGALYVDFGLYVTVKFKAQVFMNLIKYEPTLYDDEFPLLTAGVQQSVYGFALEPDEDDVMYVWDDDANSTNGISMALPEIYRTMKRIDLVTGEKSQAAYDNENFIVVFNDGRFSCEDGNIIVDVPENTRYLSCEARIVWKNDKLTFSKYDTDITVPVVWTNMSQSELNEKFTASVAVGNNVDGYTTVWSGRYGRLDVFDLPTQEEILELIDYDSYNTENGTNLKYDEIVGYQEESTGLSLSNDKTWYFNVELKEYTVTVTDVQNADGTSGNRTFTAKYGRSFDFSELQNTGTNNSAKGIYTRFLNLTDPDAGEDADNISLTMPVNMAFAEKYGVNGATFKANYLNTALTATYEFVGLGNNVPPVEVTFRSGATPSYEGLADYVRTYGGENAAIISISPAQGPSENSITYTVTCEIDESKQAYTLSFDTNGGNEEIRSQKYLEGSVIIRPTEPTREGYTFEGWYADEKLTTAFNFDAGMPGQDTTVYAKWAPRTYTVTFVTTTGTAPASIQVSYNSTYGTLPVLTDNNMRFMGWFTAATGGDQVTAETLFTSTENQKLYAQWEAKIEILDNWITITPRTENYDETEPGFPVTITVDAPDADLSAEDFTVTYLWEKENSKWTEDVPVDAGGYLVKVRREADDKYLAFEMTTSQAVVSIQKLDLSLTSPMATATNWIATFDTTNCGIKGDGTVTYILRVITEVTVEGVSYPTAKEIGRNTTGVFDLGSYGYGEGTYAVGITVTGATNYNDASSRFRQFFVDSSGNGDNDYSGQLSYSVTAESVAKPMTEAVFLKFLSDKMTPASVSTVGTARLTATATTKISMKTNADTVVADNPSMAMSPEEIVTHRGKEFEITLDLDKAADIWGVLAAVDYDPDTLELLGYACGDIFTEAQFTAQNDLSAAPYKLLATLDEIGVTSAKGNFVTLKFRVREDAPEKATAVSLQTLEVVGENTAVSVDKGGDVSMAVDETAPVIEGVKDGGTYYGDTVVTIDEENLATVTVNGEAVTVTDGKFTLKPAEGEQTVIVTDKAGNSVTVTVTVNNADHSDAGLPGTGDSSNMMLWIALLFVSGGVLGMLSINQMRKKQR